MATMIPDDVEQFHTDGEALFYRFLVGVAKPDERFVAWYLPSVLGVEPDFILYHDEVGLIVLDGSSIRTHKSPLAQARDYVHKLLDRLRADKKLLSQDTEHRGKPKIPVSYGVVFPNIHKHEYLEKRLDRVIDPSSIFFWDDLHPQSDLCVDPSGTRFLQALKERFPPRFPFRLTREEAIHLRQLLFPSVSIETPVRGSSTGYTQHEARTRLLDHHQEVLARKLDAGHRLISGPSGSGKTLVLVCQAAFLLHYHPAVRRILFVCYNVTLAHYLRRLLAAQGVPFGVHGVEVMHFFELCARLTGEDIRYEGEPTSYYDFVVELALARLGPDTPRYDAVLVDEGQDFSDDMLRVVVGLVNPSTNILTIAIDEAQDLYRRTRVWKDLGIDIRGRRRELFTVYRNTHEIAALARCMLRAPRAEAAEERPVRQLSFFHEPLISHGPKPEVRPIEDYPQVATFVAQTIRALAAARTYPLSEIAILYLTKSLPGESLSLPTVLQSALDGEGVLCRWASEDYRARRAYDISADSVALSTVHSAKGLDYACVLLLGGDTAESGERWSDEQLESLVYVGITRARRQLVIPYVQRTPPIERVLACLG